MSEASEEMQASRFVAEKGIVIDVAIRPCLSPAPAVVLSYNSN